MKYDNSRTVLSSRTLLCLGAAALLALTSTPVFGADALAICSPGVPFAYPAGGADILWNPDLGDLGPLDNAGAVAQVALAFAAWEAIPTSSATFLQGAFLAEDINFTDNNFGDILNPVAPDGLSPIVFDDDGLIFDSLFGPGSGILGFAGPDFGDTGTCELLEGSAFLNGPAFGDATAALDVIVHELGHYVNLGHVELNGQLFPFGEGGDSPGPGGDVTTFGPTPSFDGTEVIETMYPIYFGTTVGTRTPHQDDISSISFIYPDASLASTATISGAIFLADGVTRVSGVNVIARNVADPFVDAVSMFSGAYTDGTDPGVDPAVGLYTFVGLTPGAEYKVFIDEVTALAGRFSNPILQPLCGPEEFWNDANEDSVDPPDDPTDMVSLFPAAGIPVEDVDVICNSAAPGSGLPVGDDGFVELPLPFTFCITGQAFSTVFVNANGNLTFGAGDSDFTESEGEFLAGPPRIAPLWDDISPFNLFSGAPQGSVTFSETSNTFTVSWSDVPEFPNLGSNSFDVILRNNSFDCAGGSTLGWATTGQVALEKGLFGSSDVEITYNGLTAPDGLVGVSGGGLVTSGFELESDLSSFGVAEIDLDDEAAVFENFSGNDSDVDGSTLKFDVGAGFADQFEPNDSVSLAKDISLPFDSIDTTGAFTKISPEGDDVDYFEIDDLEAGQTLVAEVLTGQIDTTMGLFQCTGFFCSPSNAVLIAADDDGGSGVLSRIQIEIPADGDYVLAVSTFPDGTLADLDAPFNGNGTGTGRYVLDVFAVDGVILDLGDDDFEEVALDFTFPFRGNNYTSVFVGSNGFVTFGAGDTDFSESVGEFLSGAPRIGALWDDLSPNAAGQVIVSQGADCAVVSFTNVPEFIATGSNTFSILFDDSGNVNLVYDGITAADGLVGCTEGGGAADPGETDLSAGGPFPTTGTTYELFTGDFDLDGTTVVFGAPITCN